MVRPLLAATILIAGLTLLPQTRAQAQCAPGIPCAGNPMGIPPSDPGSPYNRHDGYPPPNGQSAPPPQWRTSWGAVAMDQKTGSAGEARNQLSKAAASDIAMKQCQIGGPNCKLMIAYYNQCVAIAQQQEGGFIIAAARAEEADAVQYAMAECGRHGACTIVYRACSDAIRVQ